MKDLVTGNGGRTNISRSDTFFMMKILMGTLEYKLSINQHFLAETFKLHE